MTSCALHAAYVCRAERGPHPAAQKVLGAAWLPLSVMFGDRSAPASPRSSRSPGHSGHSQPQSPSPPASPPGSSSRGQSAAQRQLHGHGVNVAASLHAMMANMALSPSQPPAAEPSVPLPLPLQPTAHAHGERAQATASPLPERAPSDAGTSNALLDSGSSPQHQQLQHPQQQQQQPACERAAGVEAAAEEGAGPPPIDGADGAHGYANVVALAAELVQGGRSQNGTVVLPDGRCARPKFFFPIAIKGERGGAGRAGGGRGAGQAGTCCMAN